MDSPAAVVFVKLGGSLITDKTRAYTARLDVMSRLAREVRQALDRCPAMGLLIGHGSGSFGHWAARPYNTREGVHTPSEWLGFAAVAKAAARLNRIVSDALHEAGVPVFTFQPSASARCDRLTLVHMDTDAIHAALAHSLVPLVYGDVAFDSVSGGTIISTEDIFLYLARELRPSRVILLGEAPGVLSDGLVLRRVTPNTFPALRRALTGSEGIDVTGGMADKVARMVELVERYPDVHVQILSGTAPGVLARVLVDPAAHVGTCIEAR